MKTYSTIHAIAQRPDGCILLLQRADHRDRAGKWNCITGYIQERESAEDAALRELQEETRLSGTIIRTAEPHWVDHDDARWIIIPSLIRLSDTDPLAVDERESKAHRWIRPDDPEIAGMSSLRRSLERLGLRPPRNGA